MKLQRLEPRRLFSIAVDQTYPGFYEIHGDEGANAIIVEVSQSGETFTLDGTTYVGVAYISIFGYGGNDQIHVNGDGFGYIGAGISAGEGDDDISLNFDGAIWAGSGNDTLSLMDSFRGEVYGEGGDDRMYIIGETVDAEILGGDGNDLIDATANNHGVVARGGPGDDTIYGSEYNDQLYADGGNDYLLGNGGNDTLYGGWVVHGGTGSDIYYGTAGAIYAIEHVYYG